MKRIGFIGCGNIARSIIKGIVQSGYTDCSYIHASDPFPESLEFVKKEHKINVTQNNIEITRVCDIVFLSVKPNKYAIVIDEIKNSIKESAIVIMIAAGQSIKTNEARFGRRIKLVRAMPNTPALVSEGMTAYSVNENLSEEDTKLVGDILQCFGKAELVNESLMDVVTGVSGSSPAYVYMFIEALADAAVLNGMPRKQAYTFAAQSVLGSAKTVLETDTHPAVLKDIVCSPGGTTIEAVTSLEKNGLRSAIIDAVNSAVEKSRSMSR